MELDRLLESLAAAAVAVIGAIRLLAATRGADVRLKRDAELLTLLPEGPAHDMLKAHIESQVLELIEHRVERRRDPSGAGLGLAFLVIGIWFASNGLDGAIWWWVPAVVLLVFGIVGFSESMRRVRRDERGRAIPAPTAAGSATHPPPNSALEQTEPRRGVESGGISS